MQEELSSTENRIGFARQAYNDAATRYNNAREVFPANLISGGFAEAELFEIEVACRTGSSQRQVRLSRPLPSASADRVCAVPAEFRRSDRTSRAQ